jgi:hypothetical protein
MAPSTYIIGQDSNHERWFVIRTESPRFIGEFVESDQADDGLIFEDGEGLHINQWNDPPQPASAIIPFLGEIAEELGRYNEMRGVTVESGDSPPAEPVIPPLEAL